MENQFTNLSTNSNKSAAFLYQLKASFMRLTLLMCKKSKDLQKIVCSWTFRLTTLFWIIVYFAKNIQPQIIGYSTNKIFEIGQKNLRLGVVSRKYAAPAAKFCGKLHYNLNL